MIPADLFDTFSQSLRSCSRFGLRDSDGYAINQKDHISPICPENAFLTPFISDLKNVVAGIFKID